MISRVAGRGSRRRSPHLRDNSRASPTLRTRAIQRSRRCRAHLEMQRATPRVAIGDDRAQQRAPTPVPRCGMPRAAAARLRRATARASAKPTVLAVALGDRQPHAGQRQHPQALRAGPRLADSAGRTRRAITASTAADRGAAGAQLDQSRTVLMLRRQRLGVGRAAVDRARRQRGEGWRAAGPRRRASGRHRRRPIAVDRRRCRTPLPTAGSRPARQRSRGRQRASGAGGGRRGGGEALHEDLAMPAFEHDGKLAGSGSRGERRGGDQRERRIAATGTPSRSPARARRPARRARR